MGSATKRSPLRKTDSIEWDTTARVPPNLINGSSEPMVGAVHGTARPTMSVRIWFDIASSCGRAIGVNRPYLTLSRSCYLPAVGATLTAGPGAPAVGAGASLTYWRKALYPIFSMFSTGTNLRAAELMA